MITRKVLYDIVEDNTTRNGKYFDFFIQGLILLSLVSFSRNYSRHLRKYNFISILSRSFYC